MYKLHEKSPQSGTERFKRVFTRGLNRFVPFRSILRLTFQSRPLFGTERNVSSRSRVNTCKNSFVFWNSSTSFRSVPFSCERGLSFVRGSFRSVAVSQDSLLWFFLYPMSFLRNLSSIKFMIQCFHHDPKLI